MMRKEVSGLADEPPARRRWFHDEYFDLFVWQTHGEVTLFQLCYGIDSSERALVWDKRRGFFADGAPASREGVARFEDAAALRPGKLGRGVGGKVPGFPGRRLGGRGGGRRGR